MNKIIRAMRRTVCVLGAGSYGTAMAFSASRCGHRVRLWTRDAIVANTITRSRRHPKRFATTPIPTNVEATTDLDAALLDADVVLHCIPAQVTPAFVRDELRTRLAPDVPFVCTAKGIVNGRLLCDAIPEALGDRTDVPLAYLSGPSFAKEIVANHPVSVVVASYACGDGRSRPEPLIAMRVQSMLHHDRFRLYVTDDVVGVEIGGAMKNPLAILCGMARGLNFGASTIAGLTTRGCREMRRLARAMGGRPETLAGLSGVGDLMLTCYSELSRNHRYGVALARDESFDVDEVVEGVATSREIVKIARALNIRLPLFEAVDGAIHDDLRPEDAIDRVSRQPATVETFT